jgi:hypothetical protein
MNSAGHHRVRLDPRPEDAASHQEGGRRRTPPPDVTETTFCGGCDVRGQGRDAASRGGFLVDAINTIRAAVASAEIGDDPFTLTESSVDISFAVTAEGTISLGVEGGLANELTHTLTLGLVPV